MNAGLVLSFVVAGTLLISIMTMNLRLTGSGVELTLTQITREHMTAVADMLNDDLPNMGYDINRRTEPILTYADENRIQFYRNVQRDPERQPERITWEITPAPVPQTPNPDHRILLRIERDAATGQKDTLRIRSGVTRFELRYFDQTHGKELSEQMNPAPGADSTALAGIRQIHLLLELQSAEPVITRPGTPGRYVRSVYEKRYSPRNLD